MTTLIQLQYLPKDAWAACEREVHYMNQYINDNGAIAPSTFIKTWHDRTNDDWLKIIQHMVCTDQYSKWRVNSAIMRDAELLAQHIDAWGKYHPNILNPYPKEQGFVPKQSLKIGDKTARTILWRFMMNVREFYCYMMNLDLPNSAEGVGKLTGNPNPKDLFE